MCVGVSGAYAGAGATSFGSTPYGGTPNFGKKGHPFGFDKPTGTQTPYGSGPYDRVDQAYPSTSGTYGPGSTPDYSKPENRPHTTWPSSVANTFATTRVPQGVFGPSGTVPGQGNAFSPEKSPGYPTSTTGVYSGVTKPSYGSGSSTWPGSGTTGPHAGFPASNTGFGTTKTPFGHTNTPSFASSGPYGGAGPKQPGFNVASSSAAAAASANTFGTSFGTHSTTGVTGAIPSHGTTPSYSTISVHAGNYPGVKGSSASARPTYGTAPHGYNVGSGPAWPGEQPGSGTIPGGQPGSGTGSWPERHPGGGSGTWPSGTPGSGTTPGSHPGSGNWPVGHPWPNRPGGGSGTWPGGRPSDGSGTTPGRYPGTGSGTWPGGRPSGVWPNKQTEDGSSNCGENYNCGGGCSSSGGNAPAKHGPCDGVIGGPSGVNKTYYPAGTGDGNVPTIQNTYGPGSSPNIGSGVYPGGNTECKSRRNNSCN